MSDQFTPLPEHKFTFGLWTISNPGRDPFGAPVRPPLDPNDLDRESGRGLFIIRQLADEVTFNPQGNSICMTLRRR